MTAKEILTAARAKIALPKHWCQGTFARDAEGRDCWVDDTEKIVSYCALGAVGVYLAKVKYAELCKAEQLLHAAAKQMGYMTVAHLNDDTNHATVLRMYDRALEMA